MCENRNMFSLRLYPPPPPFHQHEREQPLWQVESHWGVCSSNWLVFLFFFYFYFFFFLFIFFFVLFLFLFFVSFFFFCYSSFSPSSYSSSASSSFRSYSGSMAMSWTPGRFALSLSHRYARLPEPPTSAFNMSKCRALPVKQALLASSQHVGWPFSLVPLGISISSLRCC